MRRLKVLLFFLLIGNGICASFADGWSVAEGPAGSGAKKALTLRNNLGDTLYVWRDESGDAASLTAELQLGQGHTFTNKTPRYQIDSGVIYRLDRLPTEPYKSKEGWIRVADKAVTWRLYEGPGAVAKNDPFYLWGTGNMLRIIYFDVELGETTTEFRLGGLGNLMKTTTKVSFD